LTKNPNDLDDSIGSGIDASQVDLGALSEEPAAGSASGPGQGEGYLHFPKARRDKPLGAGPAQAQGAAAAAPRGKVPSSLDSADNEPSLGDPTFADGDRLGLADFDEPGSPSGEGAGEGHEEGLEDGHEEGLEEGQDDPVGANSKAKGGKKKKEKKKRGLLLRAGIAFLWFLLGAFLFGSAVCFLTYVYFSQGLPSVESLRNYEPKTVTFFYSDDGRVIGEFFTERRIVVPLSRIPEHVREAFLAVEDAEFFQHQGVNIKSVVRAAINNFRSESIQGGSTITQQLIRGMLLSPERKVSRKIKEMILAFRLETTLTKDQILGMYLNQIYLGQGSYGVEAAAGAYFDKHVEDLTVAEAALLAGITQSPEGKNPFRQPQEARSRQRHALDRMVAEGFLTKDEAEAAKAEVLMFRGEQPNPNTTESPYFTEHVRRLLVAKYGEDSLYNDGWQIHTTVNIEAQRAADRATARGLWEYARRRGFKGPIAHHATDEAIHAALAAIDAKLPPEGLYQDRLYESVVLEVRADSLVVAVGSYQGEIAKPGLQWILAKGALPKQLKRGDSVWVRLAGAGEAGPGELSEGKELALRRIAEGTGSEASRSFVLEQKTDVQVALLSMDLSDGSIRAMVGGRDFSESQYNRATQSQRQPGSSFKPIVYSAAMDNGFTPGSVMVDGPVVIDDVGSRRRWKPMNSDAKFLGPMPLYNALVSSRNLVSVKVLEVIGFKALQDTARSMGIKTQLPESLAVALGSHGITMPEMVTAYSSFPNQGLRVEPRFITKILDRHGNVVETFEPEFFQALSPATACELTWMLRGVVAQGTGTSVKPLDRPVGGKTGTTNDFSDAWFVGFTPEYVTAVWMGTDELKARGVGEVGGRAAGPIFLYYMQDVLAGVPVTEFKVPEGAQIVPGGAFGICYKEGTVGTGYSEKTVIPENIPEEDFLRWEMDGNMAQDAQPPATL
jgi:penicillin-binding protein 1A